MRGLKTAAIGLFCGATLLGTSAANAMLCPNISSGSSTFNRTYELTLSSGSVTGLTSCAYGDGNVNQYPFPTSGGQQINTQGYVGSYPGTQLTGPGVGPVPAGSTELVSYNPANGTQTGSGSSQITVNGGAGGTINFASGYTYTNIYVAVKDGAQNPTWAVFYLGSVTGGTALDWRYWTCNTVGAACTLATSTASGVTIWGNISAVPLPPAALLFGSALVGLGILGRRRNKARLTPA